MAIDVRAPAPLGGDGRNLRLAVAFALAIAFAVGWAAQAWWAEGAEVPVAPENGP